MSYIAQPISIIINHNFITPRAISMPRDFSLSQNRQPILAQLNLHTLYKSGQCSPKNKLFSDLLVSYRHRFHEVMAQRALMHAVPSLRENGNDMIDETFSHTYV